MAIFYNQPAAHRFGTEFIDELQSGTWHVLEVGVAWVRRSGMRHILPALQEFIHRGGVFRIAVGIDIQNTSQEGLEDLLSLTSVGTAEIFVYHDEANTTFHPKAYLFHDNRDAKLIVGSNNITESGLFVNTEAGLEITAPLTEAVIQDALAGLASWRDPTDRLSLPLDVHLLSDLIAQGYVLPETRLIRPTRAPRSTASGTGSATKTTALFGRSKVFRPPAPPITARTPTGATTPTPATRAATPAATTTSGVGKVLIMRVRKAGPTARPTQTQLPMRVHRDPFFAGATSIISAHDGRAHRFITARARGGVNTIKLEIPEMRHFADPVIRFERTASGIYYQAFDSTSVLGQPIMASLLRGLSRTPPATEMTKPRTPDSATWWRFI
jgi:HKD family nuclease